MTAQTPVMGMISLAVDEIHPDRSQPRTTFDPDYIEQLAQSLRDRGQIVPIVARFDWSLNRHVIVDGECRWRAAKLAGLKSLDAKVRMGDDDDARLEVQLVVNALREGVPPVEQARAFDRLMRSQNLTQQQLADKLRISQNAVSRSLALLSLDREIQGKVDAGELSPSTASIIDQIDDPDVQRELANGVVDAGMTRDAVSDAVRRRRPSGRRKREPKPIDFEKSLQRLIDSQRSTGVDLVSILSVFRKFVDGLEQESQNKFEG